MDKAEVDKLFNSLKLPDANQIDKDFFVDILFTMKLDTEQPDYFRFIFN